MKEIDFEILDIIVARPEEGPVETLGPIRRGVSKHYRGNHRSENRGMGFAALLRNNWMKPYAPGMSLISEKK